MDVLATTKAGKSCGEDGVSYELLNHVMHSELAVILLICSTQCCFKSPIFPSPGSSPVSPFYRKSKLRPSLNISFPLFFLPHPPNFLLKSSFSAFVPASLPFWLAKLLAFQVHKLLTAPPVYNISYTPLSRVQPPSRCDQTGCFLCF